MVAQTKAKLPAQVMTVCGHYGIRHADVADYRINEDTVTVLTTRGQKYTAQLLNLNPPFVPDPSKRRSPRRRK